MSPRISSAVALFVLAHLLCAGRCAGVLMKVYEIVNPSDACTIASDDETAACVAVLLLGEGRCALTDADGRKVLPLFLFGGSDQWLEKKAIIDLTDYCRANAGKMADALDSLIYGTLDERTRVEALLAKVPETERATARREYNDDKRSSLNDINNRASQLAARLREMAAASATNGGVS